MASINITIYWDAICPWCYIAHRTLLRAISLYQKTYPGASKDIITWTFHPFYRSLSAPTTGVPWHDAVAAKNGPDAVNAIRTRIERVGRENGILFSFGSKIGSTRDLHRMILKFARPRGAEVEREVIERVFAWHFEGDGDVTSREEIARVAVQAGIAGDEGEVVRFLEGEDGKAEVDGLVEEARGRGVVYVPTFEIEGRRLEGAEDASVFYEALVAAREGQQGGKFGSEETRKGESVVC